MRHRVTLTIDEELFRKYKSYAKKRGVSLSATMRCGLAEWMEFMSDDEGQDVPSRAVPQKRLVTTQGSKEQWGTKQNTN